MTLISRYSYQPSNLSTKVFGDMRKLFMELLKLVLLLKTVKQMAALFKFKFCNIVFSFQPCCLQWSRQELLLGHLMFLIFFIYLLLEVYLLFISKIFNFIIVKKDLHAGFLHFEFPIVPQKLYLKKKHIYDGLNNGTINIFLYPQNGVQFQGFYYLA